MFGFSYSSLFRSRWMALIWAAGICWMALDFVGSDSEGSPTNNAAPILP